MRISRMLLRGKLRYWLLAFSCWLLIDDDQDVTLGHSGAGETQAVGTNMPAAKGQ